MVGRVETDSIPLMRQIAQMAGIPEGLIRRMVLVLDANDLPKLYVEAYLPTEEGKVAKLVETKLEVIEEPVYIDTTTMQNEEWITKSPKPQRK